MIEKNKRSPENTNLSLDLFFNSKKSAFFFKSTSPTPGHSHTPGPTPPGIHQRIKPEGRAFTRKSCPTLGVPGGGGW